VSRPEPRHDLVGLGEVMLRLAARPPQRLEQAQDLDVQIGGTEANVAAACARLGLRTAFISVLPSERGRGPHHPRAVGPRGTAAGCCAGRASAWGLSSSTAWRHVRPHPLRRRDWRSGPVADDVD
jgi:hypothetical protein